MVFFYVGLYLTSKAELTMRRYVFHVVCSHFPSGVGVAENFHGDDTALFTETKEEVAARTT